jgi:hypothetical protein
LSWKGLLERGPALLQTVVCTLLPLVQQLQGCGSLLMRPAAAAAARSASTASVQAGSSSSSCEHKLQRVLFCTQQAVSALLFTIAAHNQLDAGAAAEVLRLQTYPAVAEMQLQLLTAWTAQLHKQHTAQQQQQQLPPGTAGASSSSTQQQQQLQQPAKQRHRADLLSIPAFHQDMLQLLPGGQAYLDAATEAAAGWRLSYDLQGVAADCCHSISKYLGCHLESITGQQQISRNAVLVSGAAVRLALELTLLASAVLQRRREQQRRQQQQQQQQVFTPEDHIADHFAVGTWELLRLQIKALFAASRTTGSCLPPEVLQQAGLQLLQALATPLQQWQLSRTGDSFLHAAAVAGALPVFGDTLQWLVMAACGALPTDSQVLNGEHVISGSAVLPAAPNILIRIPPCMCVLSLKSAAVSFVCAELLPGQLPSLAAAHPEAYTALIDCCLRMPVLPPDSMLVPGRLLLYAHLQFWGHSQHWTTQQQLLA